MLIIITTAIAVTFGFHDLSTVQAAGTNLIPNANFETDGSGGSPAGWIRDGYGTNTRLFDYPAIGVNGSKAAHTAISSYTSGDAKWAFIAVPVTPGNTYEYNDAYISDVPSIIEAEYQMTNGSLTYKSLVSAPAHSSFATGTPVRFTVPANIRAVSVFHFIEQIGSFTIDNASLVAIAAPSPSSFPSPTPSPSPSPSTSPIPSPLPSGSSTIVPNGDLETASSNPNIPQSWAKGGWGTNTASLTYPVSGFNGGKAAQVAISSYISGDAKWYFTPIIVVPGDVYTLSDMYKSDIESDVTLQFTRSDGTNFYQGLGTVAPTATWTTYTKNIAIPNDAVKMTMFHAAIGVGTLTTDRYSLTKLSSSSSKFNEGMVSFTFDDGYLTAYLRAFPKLDAAGFKGGAYIISTYTGFSGYTSRMLVLDLYARGHEIGTHTRTHPHLTQLALAQIHNEIDGSKNDLEAIGISPNNVFVYPYGDYNGTVKQVVKDAGFIGARSSDIGYNTKNTDRYALKDQHFEFDVTLQQVETWIDAAVANKTWVILELHKIDQTGDQYSITSQMLQDTIDYIKARSVRVVTLEEGLNMMNP